MATREQIEARIDELMAKRDALVDQLAAVDVSSATLSSTGGSKSYTNRSIADIRSKIAYITREIARLEARLGIRPSPDTIIHMGVRYR